MLPPGPCPSRPPHGSPPYRQGDSHRDSAHPLRSQLILTWPETPWRRRNAQGAGQGGIGVVDGRATATAVAKGGRSSPGSSSTASARRAGHPPAPRGFHLRGLGAEGRVWLSTRSMWWDLCLAVWRSLEGTGALEGSWRARGGPCVSQRGGFTEGSGSLTTDTRDWKGAWSPYNLLREVSGSPPADLML